MTDSFLTQLCTEKYNRKPFKTNQIADPNVLCQTTASPRLL